MARRTAPVVALLAAEVGAVVLLHRLARVDGLAGPAHDPLGWLRSASPEEVVAGGGRLVALAGAYWLLASTVLYVAARATRRPTAVWVSRLTVLPWIRQRVDRALAVSMLGATVAVGGPAFAGGPPPATSPPPVEVRDGRAVAGSPSPPPASPTDVAAPGAETHAVQPGDNLWHIAAAHLARVQGRDPTSLSHTEIARYWARVIDANRAKVRSGDPDLIYPGEVLDLPPVA